MTRPREYSREDCLEAIRRVAEEVGHPPTKDEYQDADVGPDEATVRRVLGVSFGKARRLAGLEPREGLDQRKVDIDVDYFDEISTADRAYWLGTLWGQSSQSEITSGYSLTVSHTVDERHFVEGLHEAIGAGYKIRTYEPEESREQVQFSITNQAFVENLRNLGLVDSARNVPTLPEVPLELRPHFLRGFLEVRARFNGKVFQLTSDHREKLETLAGWIEELGVERTHVGELQDGRYSFRVGSRMDAAPLFEQCWVDVDDPSIRWDEFYRDGVRSVCEAYPYPENLSFCDGDGGEPTSDGTERLDDGDEGVSDGSDDGAEQSHAEAPESTVSRTNDSEDGATHKGEERGPTVSLAPSLVLVAEDELGSGTRESRPEAVVRESVTTYVRNLVGEPYPDDVDTTPFHPSDEHAVEVAVDLAESTRAAVEAMISDDASPFDSHQELVTTALCETAGAVSDRNNRLTVDGETASLLEVVGDGDASAGAITVVENAIRRELVESD